MAKIPGQRKPGGIGGSGHDESRLLRALFDAGRGGGKPPKKRGCGFMPLLLTVLVVALILLAGCGGRARAQQAEEPVDGAPTVHVTWIHAEDTRTPIADIPWCADSSGGGTVYPCKWDTRERPAVGWDPGAAPVAIWVRTGTPCPVGKVKVSEDNSVPWACYWKGWN